MFEQNHNGQLLKVQLIQPEGNIISTVYVLVCFYFQSWIKPCFKLSQKLTFTETKITLLSVVKLIMITTQCKNLVISD